MEKRLLILVTAVVLAFPFESFSQRGSVLPQGTDIQVRLTQRLDSDTNRTGQTFEAILDQDLNVNGRLFARAGSLVMGKLVEVVDAGKVQGRARMSLTLTEIRVEDFSYPIETNNVVVEADGSLKRDATVVGGSAVLGAIIGAIAGGKKGAGLGAIIGAAGGTGAVLVTEGRDVEFEPEQKFNFILARDLRTDSRQTSTRVEPFGRGVERSSDVVERDRVEVIARDLKTKADRAWNTFRAQRSRRGMELSMALSNFANSAGIYSESVSDARETGLRSGARNLISQAEKIDTLMSRMTGTSQLQTDWAEVQDEVERLSSTMNLTYASGQRLAARDTTPYEDSGRRYFRWQGRVDGIDHIILQGNRVSIRHLQAARIVDASYDLGSSLPRYPVTVSINRLQGRGNMEILEQPTASNNYTVVVLIEDTERGSDFYEFELTWQSRN